MQLLQKLSEKKDLESQEASLLLESMVAGSMTSAQAAAALMALKMKGETPEEITAFARALKRHSVTISPRKRFLVDTCGTGGDGYSTFNVSTCAAFIAAGAGAAVAKHGNRAISSKSGSVDALESLGVKMLAPEKVEECIEKHSIGFMFAPFFNPAIAKLGQLRKELGVRTIFNAMGPLLNPAGCRSQLVGVFSTGLTGPIAKVLGSLGAEHAMAVNCNGMDEMGLGKTRVSETRHGKVRSYVIDSAEFGFKHEKMRATSSAAESAGIIRKILGGEKGASRNIAVLNAGAAVYVAGLAHSIKEGVEMACNSIDEGMAMKKLSEARRFGEENA